MKSIHELPRDSWYAVSDLNIKENELRQVILFETPLLLVKTKNNGIKVYLDACPHRGYPLSRGHIVNKDQIMCKYHGWCFNKEGECTDLPGLENTPRFKLSEVKMKIYDDLVWVNLNSEKNFDINHKRPSLDHSFTWNYRLETPAYLLIENTLDPMHTPYIHAGLVRSDVKNKKKVEIHIKNDHQKVEATYKNEGKQSGIISKLFSPSNINGIGKFIAPSILELEYKTSSKIYLCFTAYLVPEAHDKTGIILKVNYSSLPMRMDYLAIFILKPLLRRVLKQDIEVCSQQYENLLKVPEFEYKSSKVDYMLPYINAFLEGKPKESGEKEINIII